MAHERRTLLDIAKLNAGDFALPIINEVAGLYPEWAMMPARTIAGTSYKTRVRTALPTVAFRNANEGTETRKGQVVNRLVECFILDATWDVDKAVADAAEDGPEAVQAMEAADHIEAGARHLCSQFYYGTGNDAKGFPGLVAAVDSGMVVAAGGSTAKTSVWGVCFGERDAQFVVGKNGEWSDSDVMLGRLTDSNSKIYTAYWQNLQLWVGLQVGNAYSIGQISALGTDTGKTLTDDLLDALMEKFLAKGKVPDAFFMNPRPLRELKVARTATTVTGESAQWPDGYKAPGGRIIPFVPTTAITVAE